MISDQSSSLEPRKSAPSRERILISKGSIFDDPSRRTAAFGQDCPHSLMELKAVLAGHTRYEPFEIVAEGTHHR